MPEKIITQRLFKLDKAAKKLVELPGKSYSDLGLYENEDLHNWLADRIDVLGDDLKVIQREHAAINETNRRPDIVAVDGSGRIVVVEVKRDPAEGNVVWQSILYASYYGAYSPSDIVEMYRAYSKQENDEAERELLQHLDADDLADLNSAQRIILVAPSFQPEVTNAAMWLRDGAIDVSCVELRAYADEASPDILVQVNPVIPLATRSQLSVTARRFTERQTIIGERAARKDDDVTTFMGKVRAESSKILDDDLEPQRASRWAGADGMRRWYVLWWDIEPWVNHFFCFKVFKETDPQYEIPGEVVVSFNVWIKGALDQGATDAEIQKAHELAEKLGARKGWEFYQPVQAKSFEVFYAFNEKDSKDPEKVGAVLAELIREIAPSFLSVRP